MNKEIHRLFEADKKVPKMQFAYTWGKTFLFSLYARTKTNAGQVKKQS